ncbi:unnamed protein product [Arctogadus glacialis]
MSTMDTSCDSPKNSDMPNFSNVADENIADRKHVTLQDLVSSRPFKIVYDSQICLRRTNQDKIGLKLQSN